MTKIMEKFRGAWSLVALTGVLAVGCAPSESPMEAPPPALPDEPEAAMPAEPGVPQHTHDAATTPVATANLPGDDEKAAEVNGVPIMVAEIRAMFDERFAPYRRQIPPEQLESFWQAQMPAMLEMAVGQRLIKNEIAQHELSASETEIDAKLAEFKQQIPPEQTIEQLTGQTTEEIRHAISDMLTYEKLLEIYELTVSEPSEEEIQAYYDENIDEFQMPEMVQARHILLTVEDAEDDAARAAKLVQIQALRTQLTDEGADFAELAAAHSDCPSRQRGGDLGKFGRGQMVPSFEEAAFSQEPGAIGDVVETDFGYHLIQVIETEAARQAPMDEVRDHISGRLQEKAHRERQDQLLKQLRANADIIYHLP